MDLLDADEYLDIYLYHICGILQIIDIRSIT